MLPICYGLMIFIIFFVFIAGMILEEKWVIQLMRRCFILVRSIRLRSGLKANSGQTFTNICKSLIGFDWVCFLRYREGCFPLLLVVIKDVTFIWSFGKLGLFCIFLYSGRQLACFL